MEIKTLTSPLPVVVEAEAETETLHLQEWESIRRATHGKIDQPMLATDMSRMAKKIPKKNRNSQTLIKQGLRHLTIIDRMIKTSTDQEEDSTSLTITRDQ